MLHNIQEDVQWAMIWVYSDMATWFRGYSSLILDEMIGVTKTLLQIEYAPNYLVLHAAGNDVGRISSLDLCNKLIGPEGIIDQLRILMPYTTIVWSCILPRLQWRYSRNTEAMENDSVYENYWRKGHLLP